MSETTKKKIEETKETFKRIEKFAEEKVRELHPLDAGLAAKIKKAGENASEVVKHIEERSK